jgi:hypothetical protein
MRFAYADPPYFGMGKKMYAKHHDEAIIWDDRMTHIDLIAQMDKDYDGWALSCNPRDVGWLLPECPDKTRMAVWVKPYAQLRPCMTQYMYEVVLFKTNKKLGSRKPFVKDWLMSPPTRKTGLQGAKPDEFNKWVLDLVGYEIGDELVDIFTGTNSMQRTIDAHIHMV